jgi:hypothetical protein
MVRMRAPKNQYDCRYIRLLKMAPFRRRGGAWRFGANRLDDAVVERLLASGRVVRDGDLLKLNARAP